MPFGFMDKTVGIIGCGKMGAAIVSGCLNSLRHDGKCESLFSLVVSTKTTASHDRLLAQFPNDTDDGWRFNAEVGDAKNLHSEISNNLAIMDGCEIVILAFKPHMAREFLSQRLVKRALAGKMVISILGGVTTQEIQGWIKDSDQDYYPPPCVVRAIPNMAAQIGKSMTIIERNDILHPAQQEDLVWIFKRLGHVKIIDSDAFDAASMLAGSSMALLSVGLDGLLDGSVKEGLKRADALELAAHAMLGMAEMFRTGVQPADFRESVSSPGGSTITGLITVESAGVRGAFARGMIDGTKTLRE